MTTGSFTRTPLLEPAAIDDRLRERAGRPADDLRGDGVEVGGEARAVEVVEQSPQVVVLLERELALNCALPKVADLRAQLARPRSAP